MTMMSYQNKDQCVFKATADDISNNNKSTMNTRMNKKKLEEKRLQVNMASSTISRISYVHNIFGSWWVQNMEIG
jgi:hypothetical protein